MFHTEKKFLDEGTSDVPYPLGQEAMDRGQTKEPDKKTREQRRAKNPRIVALYYYVPLLLDVEERKQSGIQIYEEDSRGLE